MLGPVILALYHDSAGIMGDANRGISTVDVLAPGSAGTIGIHSQVCRIDFNLEAVVYFRIGINRCKGSMAAVSGIERALAYQSVNAGLGSQVPVGILAGYLQSSALDSRHIPLGALYQL